MLIVDVCFWKFEGSSANPDSYGEVIHLPKPDMFVAAPKMRSRAEGIEIESTFTSPELFYKGRSQEKNLPRPEVFLLRSPCE